MERLINCITEIRQKLDQLKRLALNETSTRTIIIDPILEALGWDVRNPEVVHLEYPTIDGKAVDYALKINEIPVLLVESKPLGDSLSDVKAITQIVGYAANAGIEWCVLTNGVIWKIYRTSEKCPAPDKLLFEVTYDPQTIGDENLPNIIKNFQKFSRNAMGEGILDREGERVFNDSKVKKVINKIMQDPPITLINLIKKELHETPLPSNKIKDSLYRIWTSKEPPSDIGKERPQKMKPKKDVFLESFHLEGKSTEITELYRELDIFCLKLDPGLIKKAIKQKTINYKHLDKIFCSVVVLKRGLRIFLKLDYNQLENPPSYARDVKKVGHWGTGDVELAISENHQLQYAFDLIRRLLKKA